MAKAKVDATIEKYDKLYPAAHVTLPEWSLEDGGGVAVEGYYRARPLGSRCIWTGRYRMATGQIVGPDAILPVEKMSRAQIVLELADYIGMKLGDVATIAQLYVRLVEGDGLAEREARKYLPTVRPVVPESCASWGGRVEARWQTFRKGWAPVGHTGRVV